ncbi:Uncharacterised protein [uncultured archaeon]|nr:Uncharacterised protein [uncultured archaeon]
MVDEIDERKQIEALREAKGLSGQEVLVNLIENSVKYIGEQEMPELRLAPERTVWRQYSLSKTTDRYRPKRTREGLQPYSVRWTERARGPVWVLP